MVIYYCASIRDNISMLIKYLKNYINEVLMEHAFVKPNFVLQEPVLRKNTVFNIDIDIFTLFFSKFHSIFSNRSYNQTVDTTCWYVDNFSRNKMCVVEFLVKVNHFFNPMLFSSTIIVNKK